MDPTTRGRLVYAMQQMKTFEGMQTEARSSTAEMEGGMGAEMKLEMGMTIERRAAMLLEEVGAG